MSIDQWSTTPGNNASGVTGINWAEGQAPSTVNDSARALMADAAAWYGGAKVPEYLTGVAGTNTITAGGPAAMAAYTTGQRMYFVPAVTNTGATTLNVTPSGGAALGAKNIFWNAAALVGGELRASVPYTLEYDGTQFNILSAGSAVMLKGASFAANGIPYGTASSGLLQSSSSFTYDGTTHTFGGMTLTNAGVLTNGVTLTAGAYATGNITIDSTKGPIAAVTNGGAFTITAPTADGSQMLLVTNNGSAGAITFTGFTVGANTGDALTTTNTNKFVISIVRISGTSTYSIKALQ